MKQLTAILTWLDGRKSVILSISAAVLSYCVAGHLISTELGALLQTIISILGGSAVYATNRMGISRKKTVQFSDNGL